MRTLFLLTVALLAPVSSASPAPAVPRGITHSPEGERLGRALVSAVAGGRTVQVQALLSRGADINARDAVGFTPLVMAAYMGRASLVRLLIRRGADVNANSPTELTARKVAEDGGHRQIARILRRAGAKAYRAPPMQP